MTRVTIVPFFLELPHIQKYPSVLRTFSKMTKCSTLDLDFSFCCTKAICLYCTMLVSEFIFQYLQFLMCVDRNRPGIHLIMCFLYNLLSLYHLILLCKCPTLFLMNIILKNYNESTFAKGLYRSQVFSRDF